ncbi:hypothetical protein BaRGS_00024233 [Batillaria attramentaria]|uniref:Dendritic cell-specific transmembrane protein-like domain-containing protein n=1 Tax=Batillaria attramentaria TaxID=370345 RepID=A0ABD0KBM3_9CAEN
MYENEVMKNILGFIAGMGLSLLLYAWLCLHKDYPPLYAAVFGIIGGVILTLGMAFSLSVRCLVFLTLPQMFSKKGRNFLLMYAAVLVFTYPVANFNTNMQVMANSATCGQELMINETMKLVQFATDPLAAVYDALKELLLAIKRFARMLMKAFKALIRALKEICAAVAKVFKWLYSLVDICNEKMGAPYRKCKKAFDDAYSDCRDRLGIFKFLCEIVDAASNLCHIVRVGELLCAIGGAVKDLVVSSVEKATTGTSRSYTEVKDAIMAEIKAKIESFSGVMSVLDNVMMLTVFTIFTKAWSYRTRYLTKDKYDNYYITEYVHEMDARRKELGRECIFPLKESENLKYIPLTSFKVTAKEGRKMLKGLAFWAFGAYYSAIYLIMDYSLYWVLDMVSRALNVKTSAEIPAYLQLHVNG